jgi:hypothetical protein
VKTTAATAMVGGTDNNEPKAAVEEMAEAMAMTAVMATARTTMTARLKTWQQQQRWQRHFCRRGTW